MEFILLLAPALMLMITDLCGSFELRNCIVPNRPANERSTTYRQLYRIIGGDEVLFGEFPWIALLRYKLIGTKDKYVKGLCGGSLITSRHVLTAAHCVVNVTTRIAVSKERKLVEIGAIRLGYVEKEADSPVEFHPEKFLVHRMYNETLLSNDIAIIKLDRNVIFTSYVHPIELLPAYYDGMSFTGEWCTVAGWGITSFKGSSSPILQKVQVRVTNYLGCLRTNQALNRTVSMQTIMNNICAMDDGKDACQGDSGGPMMYYPPDKDIPYLIGIVSYGYKCAVSGVPGVYTRVSAFRPWIESLLYY